MTDQLTTLRWLADKIQSEQDLADAADSRARTPRMSGSAALDLAERDRRIARAGAFLEVARYLDPR